MFTLVKSGLFTQWTDAGRKGAQIKGYSQSGAIDWFNFELANALCGNPLDSPVLEVMGGNIELKFDIPCVLSVTGAPVNLSINGQAKKMDGAVRCVLQAQDVLQIGQVETGLFNYIAFSTSFDLPLFANSVCEVKRESLTASASQHCFLQNGTYFKGETSKALSNAGARLFEHNALEQVDISPAMKALHQKQKEPHKSIPFTFCYQAATFSTIERQRFLAHDYQLSHDIDKMGVRLNGPTITSATKRLTSQGMVNGSIQISGEGKPIVMRNDRQTIGGYPIIGTVNSEGLAILSQATPGQSLRFEPTDFGTSAIWRQLIDIQLKQVLNNTLSLFDSQ